MSAAPAPLRLALTLVAASAWLIPRAARREWQREWSAEIRGHWAAAPLHTAARSLGAVRSGPISFFPGILVIELSGDLRRSRIPDRELLVLRRRLEELESRLRELAEAAGPAAASGGHEIPPHY